MPACTQDQLAREVTGRLEDALETARIRLGGLAPHQSAWRPSPGAWSVDQCLAHLIASYDAYLPEIVRATGSTAPRAPGTAGFRPNLAGRLIRAGVGPQVGRRFKTPKIFNPASLELPGPALEGFIQAYEGLKSRVISTRELDWHRIKIPSPVTGLLRPRLGDAYWILAAHAQRHVGQAIRVAESAEFPDSEAA
ncbi:MAG: DinB family protein [Gemmatimonadota bacterium]|nr:DinB family protein [Gemmatimonadota bacterium]